MFRDSDDDDDVVKTTSKTTAADLFGSDLDDDSDAEKADPTATTATQVVTTTHEVEGGYINWYKNLLDVGIMQIPLMCIIHLTSGC